MSNKQIADAAREFVAAHQDWLKGGHQDSSEPLDRLRVARAALHEAVGAEPPAKRKAVR